MTLLIVYRQPPKGVMVRQCILQLFSEAGHWASLINANEPLTPSSSELHDLIQATYKPGTQSPSEILMKDLAIWLGKYAGMTYIHATCLEGYATHALSKTVHSNTACIGKCLHGMAKSKDCLNCKKRWLEMSKWLDNELSVWALTSQPSVTANTAVAQLPYDTEGSSMEVWPMLAPYTCWGSFKNKAIFFFNWPLSFSIFSHCLQFQKT